MSKKTFTIVIMSKKTLTIVLAGLFAVFAVAMAALVFYGRATHEEPTFMRVCWTDNKMTWVEGGLEEENRGSCEEPEELVWPKSQIPLTVTVEPYAGALPESAPDQVRAAVDLVNSQLGYTHLRYRPAEDTAGGKGADVRVVYGAPFEAGDGATRAGRAAASCSIEKSVDRHDADGGIRTVGAGGADQDQQRLRLHSRILLRDISDLHLTHRILVHELGHCALGLDHDPFTASIMYPFRAADEGEKMEFLRFTDADVKAVRAKYAP